MTLSSTRFRRALLGAAASAVAVMAAAGSAGCEIRGFLDPAELVDPSKDNRLTSAGRADALVVPILDELDLGVTRDPDAFADARDVQARDLELSVEDYRIGPGDLLRVQVPDLLGRGQQPSVTPVTVSETGNISLPDIGQVNIEGLTSREAEEVVNRQYAEQGILVNPQANVVVVEAFNRTFSVLGNVAAPGRFAISQSDFRLLDALVLARGSPDPLTAPEYVYVIRDTSPQRRPGAEGGNNPGRGGAQPVPAGPGTGGVRPGTNDPLAPRSEAPVDAAGEAAPLAAVAAVQPAGRDPAGDDVFQFQPPAQGDREVIRIPIAELLRGQFRYNVVIRPNDLIVVPTPEVGEYYMGGHVAATGAYAILPGRQITLKQAVVASRMLDAVAIPQRTQLIRRINNQDVFVRVNLAKIFVGQEPDLFLKANDIVLVGTNLPAPFLAAIRNGFRVTYGFGFLYDRNFANENNDNRFLGF